MDKQEKAEYDEWVKNHIADMNYRRARKRGVKVSKPAPTAPKRVVKRDIEEDVVTYAKSNLSGDGGSDNPVSGGVRLGFSYVVDKPSREDVVKEYINVAEQYAEDLDLMYKGYLEALSNVLTRFYDIDLSKV